MRRISRIQHVMDHVAVRQIFDMCWLSASFGVSIVQMLVLAQAWYAGRQALVPACLVSLWTLGSLVGRRMRYAPHVWGNVCLVCMLLWWGGSSLASWQPPHSALSLSAVSIAALAVMALLLGTSSSAWLSQQRCWPAVGEWAVLVRSLVGLTIGLVVAWTLPAWAPLIALTCCGPRLVLDSRSSRWSPLPRPGGVAARWGARYWTADRWQVQLEQPGPLQNWRWLSPIGRSAAARETFPLTLLASAVAVVLGCVWGAVPTPFAASLRAAHSLETLYWLLGGQIGALAIGTCCLVAARGMIGFPARLLLGNWQTRVRSLAALLPLGMAASLLALGLPFLQAPWWLALSLANYTLADAAWGILLPRLRPGLTRVPLAQRSLLLGRRAGLIGPLQIAHGQACEARVVGVLIVAITPFLGWVIDRLGSVDDVLVMVSLVFALGLVCSALAWALFASSHRPARPRSAFSWQSLRFPGSAFPKLGAAADR